MDDLIISAIAVRERRVEYASSSEHQQKHMGIYVRQRGREREGDRVHLQQPGNYFEFITNCFETKNEEHEKAKEVSLISIRLAISTVSLCLLSAKRQNKTRGNSQLINQSFLSIDEFIYFEL